MPTVPVLGSERRQAGPPGSLLVSQSSQNVKGGGGGGTRERDLKLTSGFYRAKAPTHTHTKKINKGGRGKEEGGKEEGKGR